eukprot:CAMPEP_0198141490 /NCGR_PEP_ID=MMETSP1443-20131203/4494_1 /TAXON_ID=186043 /ORGANISM="Entomoneis sp., Strain CCMP2396" /LENGTH=277 /DNA_ID=CAMNT_0043804263 /DNA_START=76 /DNA_END=909 /DNA_ORIENTATION=+
MAPNTTGKKLSRSLPAYEFGHDDHRRNFSDEAYDNSYESEDVVYKNNKHSKVEFDTSRTRKRTNDLVSTEVKATISNKAEVNGEQEVGLKLLFAASLIQSNEANNHSSSIQSGKASPEISPAIALGKVSSPTTPVHLPPTSFLEAGTPEVIHQLVDKDVSDLDVLCGRGGKINKHPGNIAYRRVVEHNKTLYKQAPKRHRILVSQSIVQTIQTHGGRFLQSGQSTTGVSSHQGGVWTTIPFRRAVQKTSQALREPAQSENEVETKKCGKYELATEEL